MEDKKYKTQEYNMGFLKWIKIIEIDGKIIGIFEDGKNFEKKVDRVRLGGNMNEIEKNAIKYIQKEMTKYQNKANELEELALRIKENVLEKTSRYYQTHSNVGGKK